MIIFIYHLAVLESLNLSLDYLIYHYYYSVKPEELSLGTELLFSYSPEI